jgi:hypothetical protein
MYASAGLDARGIAAAVQSGLGRRAEPQRVNVVP